MNEHFTKDERIPLLLAGLFALLLALSLWQIGDTFHLTKLTPLRSFPTTKPVHTVPNIAKWHLFGQFDKRLANLPETQLQLTLEGTVVNTVNPKHSHAIISTPNQPPKVYQIGQAISGGAVLRQVLRDRVILDNNGKLENLRIPLQKLNNSKFQ